MKRIGVMLTAFILTLVTGAAPAHETNWLDAKQRYNIWNDLCFEYTPDRTCGNIQPPQVKRVRMKEGLRGYYDGGDTVYINNKLYGMQKYATTLHEMSHYLDTRLGLNPEMPVKRSDTAKVFGICKSEKRAWDLTDKWWVNHLRPGRAVGGRWVEWYDHCRQFADKLYPEKYAKPLPPLPSWRDLWGRL